MRKVSIIVVFAIASAIITACTSLYPTAGYNSGLSRRSADLVNGKNLAFNICGQCHYNYQVGSFVGKEMRDLPGFMGKVYSSNLTKGHVLSQYSDEELFYLIKTGIAHDGHFIPYMIRPTIADKDLTDIIAYLRTDDQPLTKNDSLPGTTKLSLLGKLAIKVGAKPQPIITGIKQPEDNPLAKGKYLVDVLGCYHCHSKSIIGLNYTHPEASKGYLAGGMKWKINGAQVHASNITPDVSTGIGEYDTASFRKAVREGVGLNGLEPVGRKLHYPMPHFKRLTNEQVDAIYSYLYSLAPVHNKVKHQQ